MYTQKNSKEISKQEIYHKKNSKEISWLKTYSQKKLKGDVLARNI